MLRHDYIIRQILQLVKVVARIVRKLIAGKLNEADQEVRAELSERTGLDLDTIGNLSVESMVDVVGGAGAGGSEPVRMLATAEMLGLEADICDARGDTLAATEWRVRALTLYLESHAALSRDSFDLARGRLKVLLVALRDTELPEITRVGLFRYLISIGALDRAEDVLFQLLDDKAGGPGLLDEGISVYRSLLDRTDAALVAGGLPRDEVVQGLAELESRASQLAMEKAAVSS
jgi:hypothetical protein